MQRREFFKSSAGLGVLSGLGFARSPVPELGGEATMQGSMPEAVGKIGRPARVVSISFTLGKRLQEIAELVDQEGSRGTDLIALPETWRGQNDEGSQETLGGPTVTTIATLARKHRTYIVCPIDRQEGNRRFNSAVLLDRTGQVACVYNKVFPYWSEYDVRPPVEPGQEVPVHRADFGHVGFATCFDVNFPEVWQRLSDQGAELVIWPSAYSAGASLQAHALNLHFYIVTSTQTPDCLVYDITGERLLYSRGTDVNVSRITLDLDRGIYHEDFNIPKRDKLLKERGEDVFQENYMQLEQWFVLRAKRPGVSAREVAREYGLEELRDYIARSRREIDKRRGWEFAKKATWKESKTS